MHTETRLTNDAFSHQNQAFLDACKLAGIKPSARQAGKFRRELGIAFKATAGRMPTEEIKLQSKGFGGGK